MSVGYNHAPDKRQATVHHRPRMGLYGSRGPCGIVRGNNRFHGVRTPTQMLRLHAPAQGRRTSPDNPPSPAFAWDRFNKKRARRLAGGLNPPAPMHTPEDIDHELASLTHQLHNIAEIAARHPAGGRSHLAWNLEVEQAHAQAVSARRMRLQASALANRRDMYDEANQQFRRALAAQSRVIWWRGVHEASYIPSKLWNLERWARLRSHLPPAPQKSLLYARPPAALY